ACEVITGHEEGCKHGGDDSDDHSDRKAFDGACIEIEKNEGGDDSGNVRIYNRAKCFFIAGGDSRREAPADREFFFNSLEDQNVGVDGHSNSEDNPCNPGKREGGANILEDRPKDEEIENHSHRGDKACKSVVENHRYDDEKKRDEGCCDPLIAVLL